MEWVVYAGSPARAGIDPALEYALPLDNGFPRHKWVGGHTFEYEFDWEMPVNPHYQAERVPKSSPVKPRKAPSALEPAPPAAEPSKAGKAKKPKRARLTPEELKERRRQRAVKRRQNRKERGICIDCPNRAVEGQTRCSDCVAKRRNSHSDN